MWNMLVLYHDIASYVPFKAGVDYTLAYQIISRVLLLNKYNKSKTNKRLGRGQNRVRVTYSPIGRGFSILSVNITLIYR